MPLVQSILVSIVAGAVAALITATLTYRRFQSEQWWHKKAAVYGNIFESLAKMRHTLEL